MDGLSIGAGNLAGKGVFATRRFAAGEVVIAFALQPLTSEQFHALAPGEELFVHSYGGRRWLYPPPARWVNHSDDPSCYQDFERLCDVALRPIEVGEAITIDARQETSREPLHLSRGIPRRTADGQPRDSASPDRCRRRSVGSRPRRARRRTSQLDARRQSRRILDDVEWRVGTGRWEALCSAELAGKDSVTHTSLLLRVLSGNWQVVYEHRG